MRAIRIRYVLTRLLPLLIALVFFGVMGQSCSRHADADAEAIRTLSSERADVQKQIEQSHGKLMLAAELLREDINGKRTRRIRRTIA